MANLKQKQYTIKAGTIAFERGKMTGFMIRHVMISKSKKYVSIKVIN